MESEDIAHNTSTKKTTMLEHHIEEDGEDKEETSASGRDSSQMNMHYSHSSYPDDDAGSVCSQVVTYLYYIMDVEVTPSMTELDMMMHR